MNCQDFHDRLQRQLDDRLKPESDLELARHSQQCPACLARLNAWRQISLLLPLERPQPARPVRTPYAVRWTVGGVIAATLGGMILLGASLLGNRVSDDGGERNAAEFFAAASMNLPRSHDSAGIVSSPAPSVSTDLTTSQLPDRLDEMAATSFEVPPTEWLRQVYPSDWLGDSMPTVRSFQEGVAPLGRTLMRAVTLLTLGSRDPTS